MIKFQHLDRRKIKPDEELQLLQIWGQSNDGVIVNTCSRLEHYSGEDEVGSEVAEHLFRLTAGLESVILGEGAIQGQVKKAYTEAGGNVSSALHQLFQRALYVGRRVRTETKLTQGAVSYSQASVELVLKNLEHKLIDANITLAGANALNESIIRYLVSKGAKTIFIANRTYIKAQHLAKRHHCKALSFSCLEEILSKTDVLISTTSAPHFVIRKERFPKDKQMLILDLAMPLDVDPEIGKLAGVRLFTLNEIEQNIDQNMHTRMQEVKFAESIIKEEVERFIREQKERSKLSA